MKTKKILLKKLLVQNKMIYWIVTVPFLLWMIASAFGILIPWQEIIDSTTGLGLHPNIFFVFIETYPIKSMRFIFSAIGLLLFTLALLYVPAVSKIFYLKPISLLELSQCLGICFVATLPSFLIRINKIKS